MNIASFMNRVGRFLGRSDQPASPALRDARKRSEERFFNDWRDGFYPERRRALNEAHARTGYPIKPYARISLLSRRFSSQEDMFRRLLMERDDPHRYQQLCEDLNAQDDGVRRRAEIDWLGWNEELINRLRPNFTDSHTDDGRWPCLFSDIMAESVARWSKHTTRNEAEGEIERLESLFLDPDKPLYATASDRAAYLGPNGRDDDRLMKPYQTAGSPKYRWFNFWKLGGQIAKKRALRLNVERFGLNQSFIAVEDFDRSEQPDDHDPLTMTLADNGRRRDFFKPVRAQPRPEEEDEAGLDRDINTDWTAIDSISEELRRHEQHMGGPFRWYGSLAAAAHIWVLPVSHALRGLPRSAAKKLVSELLEAIREAEDGLAYGRVPVSENKQKQLADIERGFIEKIGSFARDFFNYPDLTRDGAPRRDFVMSRVVGGRAILLSDMRAYSRDQGPRSEKAVRAVILDIDLNEEQRGRLVKRLTDAISANTLATRGFLLVDAINGALNDIGVGLSFCYSRMLDIANRSPTGLEDSAIWSPEAEKQIARESKEHRERLRREFMANLLRLRQLSTHLSALNHFITYGVSGSALASRDFRRLVEERVMSMRESRMGGYQTLEEFMRRFQQPASSIDRMADRYDVLRRRLAEASQQFRAEAQGLELSSIEQQSEHQSNLMWRTEALSFVFIAVGIFTVLDILIPDLELALRGSLLLTVGIIVSSAIFARILPAIFSFFSRGDPERGLSKHLPFLFKRRD